MSGATTSIVLPVLLILVAALLPCQTNAASPSCVAGDQKYRLAGGLTRVGRRLGLLVGPNSLSPTSTRAINLNSGKVLWTRSSDSARVLQKPDESCVFPNSGRVVALRAAASGSNLAVEKLELQQNSAAWLTEVPMTNGTQFLSAPRVICYSGYVLVEFGLVSFSGARSASYAALSAETGDLLWVIRDTTMIPVFGNAEALVFRLNAQNKLVKAHPLRGDIEWEREFHSYIRIHSGNGFLYVESNRRFMRINIQSGAIAQTIDADELARGSPETDIYISTSSGISRVSRKRLTKLWTFPAKAVEFTALKGVGVAVLSRERGVATLSLVSKSSGNLVFARDLPENIKYGQLHSSEIRGTVQLYLTYSKRVLRLNPQTGRVIWRGRPFSTGAKYKRLSGDTDSIYIHQEPRSYFREDRGAFGLYRSNGKRSWRFRPPVTQSNFFVADLLVTPRSVVLETSSVNDIIFGLTRNC